MAQLKKCAHCGKEFEIRESNDVWNLPKVSKFYRHRKYCSDACKQAAYRVRALDRNVTMSEGKHQGGVMPHLEEWAKKHGLI